MSNPTEKLPENTSLQDNINAFCRSMEKIIDDPDDAIAAATDLSDIYLELNDLAASLEKLCSGNLTANRVRELSWKIHGILYVHWLFHIRDFHKILEKHCPDE